MKIALRIFSSQNILGREKSMHERKRYKNTPPHAFFTSKNFRINGENMYLFIAHILHARIHLPQ